MNLFRSKKNLDDSVMRSPENGKLPRSPSTPSGKSPDSTRIIISKSSPKDRPRVVNELEEDGFSAIPPLSPLTVYASTPSGCRSPLEPKREKKEKKMKSIENSPAGFESPKNGKESLGSSSPLLPRRMVTSPVQSPGTSRNSKEEVVEKKNAPIVQMEVKRVELNSKLNGSSSTLFKEGMMLVHPSQPFRFPSESSIKYIISLSSNNGENELIQNLEPKKLVLNVRPRVYVMVDEVNFVTVTLETGISTDKVVAFEDILSQSCHFEKMKWEQEAINKNAIATDSYEAGDLRFNAGDHVNIIREDGFGYFMGECQGNKGRFPAYLVKLEEEESELPFKGNYKLYRVFQQNMVEINPATSEFSKNGSWMQSWIQMKNLSTGLWSDCYLQAKTCGLLWYQSSNSAPEGFALHKDIWTVTSPLKDEEQDEDHPNAFALVCKDQRLILSPDSSEKTTKWIQALEFVGKITNPK
eukprot:TRINITY_DN5158_c0_g1_i1.p1 TRINITY_DN5158_c0_g1~~TRINITY_DN5158_c0_g1_i1.p1  ORF type:complete len:468 (-),score=145.12 TRINITY_DN5158_c0_g1_i1:39-1442(-)